MLLDAEVERVNAENAVVKLSGRMTLGMRLHEIESTLNKLVENGVRRLALEMSGVEYVDSAGLGLLVLLYGKMKTVKGDFCLVAPRESLLQLLQLTSTDKLLTVYPDRAATFLD